MVGHAQKSLALHSREQGTWVAHNFWPISSALTSSAFTPFGFFPTRVVLHSLLTFQALALITIIMLSHCLQFFISPQSLVHQVSKSQFSCPSWYLLKFPVFPSKWPPLIYPVDLISLDSSPSQVFVPDLAPQGPCLSVLTQMMFSPSILISPSGPFFPHSVLHSPSYVSIS